MKIRDKLLKKNIDVRCGECQKYKCYWPRPDPGVFTQGQGYKARTVNSGWICGTREVKGCPDNPDQENRPPAEE